MLVALFSVRVLLLSAKQLFLAAKQLFLAAKHAVACMSLPRGRFQRELSATQRGYTLWTVHYGIVPKWCCLPLSNPACHPLASDRQPGRAGCMRSSTMAIG